MVILSMYVVRNCTSDRHKLSARSDRKKPIRGHDQLENRLKRDSRLASQKPRFRIKSNESVKPRHIEQCASIIQATISVTAPLSVRKNGVRQSIQVRDLRNP